MLRPGGRLSSSRRRVSVVIPIWLLCLVWMWSWWLQPSHIALWQLYVPLTIALLYQYAVVPASYLFFTLKAKLPKRRQALLHQKVAVITPCVPALESLEIIERQLQAMSAITYPHDSWILDESGSSDLKKLARRYGVKYFSRKGIAKYNLAGQPFKAKTKAGNINAWLYRVKRRNYDFFVQLDIDHVPKPDYLDKTLRHFRDKRVGWVQAPSVYGNLNYWIARGAAEQERGLHGPLQMGLYGNSGLPVIIGSHTTFRMSAIREIGGFQPTRAEDHLNTQALAAHGWQGVYLPEIIAVGDGPETLSAYLSQQYAWAYSMFQILKTYSFQWLRRMNFKQQLQFIFMLTWYPLWSLSSLVLFSIPIIGLFLGISAVHMTGREFLIRCLPLFIASWLVWWAGKPLTQQREVRFSWRGTVLQFVSWPIILKASLAAALGRTKPYQITPKGRFLRSVPTIRLYQPFLLLSLVSALSILVSVNLHSLPNTRGLMIFALVNIVTMLSVCLVDLHMRLKQVKLKPRLFIRYWLKPTLAILAVLVIGSTAFISSLSSSRQVLYAAILPSNQSNQRNINVLAPRLLTNQEISQQLTASKEPTPAGSLPDVGVYNPDRLLPTKGAYIRETFVDWREYHHLAVELLTSERVGALPLITLEPKGDKNGQRLLRDISSGRYDERLLPLLDLMSQASSPVYLRFAHEMDLPQVFAWGVQDPALYVRAYRHVVSLARQHKYHNLRFMWSPAGTPAAANYYPGDDVVDAIGVTILYDRYWNGDSRPSFHELTAYRDWLKIYGKPLWVAEYGVGKADPTFQRQLLRDGAEHFKEYGYSALVYINIHDSNLNSPDYRFPNVMTLSQTLGLYNQPIAKPVMPKNDKCIPLIVCHSQQLLNPGSSSFLALVAPR